MKIIRDPHTFTQLQQGGGGGGLSIEDAIKLMSQVGNGINVFGSGNTTGSTNTQSNNQKQRMRNRGAPVTQTNLPSAQYKASVMPRVRRLLSGVGVNNPTPAQLEEMWQQVNMNGRLSDDDHVQMWQQQNQSNVNTANTEGGTIAPVVTDNRQYHFGKEGEKKVEPDKVVEPEKVETDPITPPGPGGEGGGDDITSKMNPLKWVNGELPGLNWLPMALAPLSMLGALGEDPVFNRHETSQFWRDDFKSEFKDVSEDARTDPYHGKFFRNANRAALTSTNIMLANDAQTREKQRLAGGQLFAGGSERALGSMAGGYYANQGNLLATGYNVRDRAVAQENQYVNHNTDKNQELFQFEVAQGTHSKYNRGMNLFNRALSGAMAGAGMGLDMTGKLFDLTTQKAMAEQSLGHYEGGGGTTEITGRDAQQAAKSDDAGVPPYNPNSVLFGASNNENAVMPSTDKAVGDADFMHKVALGTVGSHGRDNPMSRRELAGDWEMNLGGKKKGSGFGDFDFARDGRWKDPSVFGGR